jgi:transcriptional regulator with XRE-family HTH domain
MIAAQHIKDLRLEKNYTQAHLAHELGISQKTYSNLECGKTKITVDNLFALAKLYDIQPNTFLEQIENINDTKVATIKKEHVGISENDLYNGINVGLPHEIIRHYKDIIDNLHKIIASKDLVITQLKAKAS